jgi:predicted secreted protein
VQSSIVRRGSRSRRLLDTAIAVIIWVAASYAMVSAVAQSKLHAQLPSASGGQPGTGWHTGGSLAPSMAPAGFVTVTDEDDGETVALRPGQGLQIRLKAYPDGCTPPHPNPRVRRPGCTWRVVKVDKSVLSLPMQSLGYAGPHAPGEQTFLFTPKKPGTTRLKLAYERWWDKAAPPIETYELTVSTDVTSP